MTCSKKNILFPSRRLAPGIPAVLRSIKIPLGCLFGPVDGEDDGGPVGADSGRARRRGPRRVESLVSCVTVLRDGVVLIDLPRGGLIDLLCALDQRKPQREQAVSLPSGDTSRSRTSPKPVVIDLVRLNLDAAGAGLVANVQVSPPAVDVMRSRASMSLHGRRPLDIGQGIRERAGIAGPAVRRVAGAMTADAAAATRSWRAGGNKRGGQLRQSVTVITRSACRRSSFNAPVQRRLAALHRSSRHPVQGA